MNSLFTFHKTHKERTATPFTVLADDAGERPTPQLLLRGKRMCWRGRREEDLLRLLLLLLARFAFALTNKVS